MRLLLAISLLLCGLLACRKSKEVTGPSNTETGPKVISTVPTSGEGGVSITTSIKATFDRKVQAGSIHLTFNDPNIIGQTAVADSTVTFTPNVPLVHKVTYTVTVAAGVKDLLGNASAKPYQWSFSTSQI